MLRYHAEFFAARHEKNSQSSMKAMRSADFEATYFTSGATAKHYVGYRPHRIDRLRS
jgi:hypothetical protein